MSLLNQILKGIAGGLAGASAMSLMMLAGKQLGMIRTPVPNQIEYQLELRTGQAEKTSPAQKAFLAQAMHHLIGASFGGVYGLLGSLVSWPDYLLGMGRAKYPLRLYWTGGLSNTSLLSKLVRSHRLFSAPTSSFHSRVGSGHT